MRRCHHPVCIGGDGGHAGGGLGGSSLAIAHAGAPLPKLDGGTQTPGLLGNGGLGSDPNLSSSRGQDGKSSQLEALLP